MINFCLKLYGDHFVSVVTSPSIDVKDKESEISA